MTHGKLAIFLTALAPVFGLPAPHPTLAQPVNSLPDGPVACDAFQRSGNGSWTVLRPATLYTEGVALSLAPRQTFTPNQMFEGFEITAILDRDCGNM